MRVGLGLAAGLVAVFAIAASLSAQSGPPQRVKVRVPPSATADLNSVARPSGPRQSIATSGAQFLTADECANLGGSVASNEFSGALCASKKLCVTKDNMGKNHAVCLEVQ